MFSYNSCSKILTNKHYTIGRFSPLTAAARYFYHLHSCKLIIIKQFLLAGADVNFPTDDGETSLMIAAQFGNRRMCNCY